MMNVSHGIAQVLRQKKTAAFPPDLCVTERRETFFGKRQVPVAGKPRSGKGRRAERGERRRLIDPTTCERDYNHDEIEFMTAMDHYKGDNRRQFPTWSEVLEVLHALGYRKTAEPMPMPGLPSTMPSACKTKEGIRRVRS